MGILYYHPLGAKCLTYNQEVYQSCDEYGNGFVDIIVPIGTPLYAMCSGTIIAVGSWPCTEDQKNWDRDNGGDSNIGTTYCILECPASANGLNKAFYIRYLHGDFNVEKGDTVTIGYKIGTSHSHGNSSQPHLHLDFTFDSQGAAAAPILGKLDSNYQYKIDNSTYLVNKDKINTSLIQSWTTNNSIGYSQLIMAYKQIKTQTSDTSNKINITAEELYNACNSYTWPSSFRIGSKKRANGLINFANALIKVGFNAGAAISIASNSLFENLNNCLTDDDGNVCGWGEHTVREGGIDCGLCSFHDPNGGRAYTTIVQKSCFPYLKKKGYTTAECEKGDFEVQAVITKGIVDGDISGRFMARSATPVTITTYSTKRQISGSKELQKKYQSDYNQYFMDSNNDVETGALLWERLYEVSAQYTDSLQGRALMAYIFAKTAGVI